MSVLRAVSPVDGSVYAEREPASSRAIEAALETSVRAQKRWRETPIAERVAIVRRMADWCVQRADTLGEELTRQMGRPVALSLIHI